jgi:hypothetical protein
MMQSAIALRIPGREIPPVEGAGSSGGLSSNGEEYVAIYRVVFHDRGELWYGLHEVEFDDAGQVVWWNKEAANFKCGALDGRAGIT